MTATFPPVPPLAAAALRVLIVQPEFQDGPAHLATHLAARGVRPQVCLVERGDEVPTEAGDWDAIAVLGGPMSVNDPLPFLPRCRRLLADAVQRGVPVLGHCLGGQLLAQALGAAVTDHPQPEIGWGEVALSGHPLAADWFGTEAVHTVFQWHFQTFGLPPGAVLLAGNAACSHQAFAWGPHLGMQFHIEVDAEKLGRWADEAPAPDDPLAAWPTVQTPPALRAGTARHLPASLVLASRLYDRWLALAAAARAERRQSGP
jgi:GMP synthase-like glutamine amidotransferase